MTAFFKTVAFGFFLAAAISILKDVQAFSDVMIQDFQECKEENNVTDADLDKMKKKELPDSREAKCFLACMLGRTDMMDGSKLNAAGAKGMISQIEDMTSEDRDKLMECIDDCDGQMTFGDDDDECENAVKISMFIHQCAVQKGLKQAE